MWNYEILGGIENARIKNCQWLIVTIGSNIRYKTYRNKF